jgi:hypothetical protein
MDKEIIKKIREQKRKEKDNKRINKNILLIPLP